MPPDDTSQRRRVRVRMERQLTFSERILLRFDMTRLPRRQRNERLAIIAMIVVAALYLVLRPIISSFFASSRRSSAPEPATTTTPVPPAKSQK